METIIWDAQENTNGMCGWLDRAEEALLREEFTVVYQPKFDINSLSTVGAEALVRWMLPDGRVIPPSDFIPMFEKQGLIEKLDFYVWEKTCQMLSRAIGNGVSPVPVSVNFSRLHIHTPDFAQKLHKTVQRWGLPAGLLEIEFTESAFIKDVPPLDSLIDQLHRLGYTVAIDDFGAGFSTLNDLMNLNVDVLKLDRAFLRLTGSNVDRAHSIISAIIRMAQALGMRVVAEGIEDLQALGMLRSCGCDVGQGFLYSRPIGEKEFLGSLVRQAAAG